MLSLKEFASFFYRSYFTLNKKTYFKSWCPISRERNNLKKQKKKQIKAERCNFHVQLSVLTNTHSHNIFLQDFYLVKNAKKRRGWQMARGTLSHVKQVEILKSKSYSLKPHWIFFNFIDLQPRYHTSSIGHPFNFKRSVITVFLRDTGGSRRQVFRVRACARMCACVGECVCVYARVREYVSMLCTACVHIWMTCVVHL